MAQEVDEVVDLTALKQPSAENEGAAANARPKKHPQPKASSANAGLPFRGPEQRRRTRYQCQGTAGMREDGTGLQSWAKFTDISLHGCYVEARANFPVGAILQMKLEANGVRVENKGCVRVSYPHLGMGIAFVETTDETRGLLLRMLGTIPRPASIAASALDPTNALPPIVNPTAAILALLEFFERRQTISREDFRRILHKSQGADTKA